MKKSIIGFGYKPNNARAICLKTSHVTLLGDAEYRIIADPYLRKFSRETPNPFILLGVQKVTCETMAVNVLDPATGLTYAVEYEPANLVRKLSEETFTGGSKLIGSQYNPEGLKVLDLETLMSVNLGSRKYRVVSEPYTNKYGTPKNIFFDLPGLWSVEQAWIDIVDPVTERKYAVEFVPARVREETGKPKEPRPAKVDAGAFLRRMKEIAQEIDSLTGKNPELREECAVVFFATKRNSEEKTADGVSLISGETEVLVDSMAIPARKSKAIAKMIRKAAEKISAWQLIRGLTHADNFML